MVWWTVAACDASAAPSNGAVGDCTSSLASGSMCQPTCDSGYSVSGASSCSAGSLTAATCNANGKLHWWRVEGVEHVVSMLCCLMDDMALSALMGGVKTVACLYVMGGNGVISPPCLICIHIHMYTDRHVPIVD